MRRHVDRIEQAAGHLLQTAQGGTGAASTDCRHVTSIDEGDGVLDRASQDACGAERPPLARSSYRNRNSTTQTIQELKTMTKINKTSIIALTFGLLVAVPLSACSTQQAEPRVADNAGCAQLAGADDVLERVYAPGAIYDAQPIEERVFKARANQPLRTMGASLYVQADSDMNAPHLRRVLACHAASDNDAHSNDPLRPATGQVAEVSVEEAKNGFAIRVKADDHEVGEEIWNRARAMTQDSVQVQQVGAADEVQRF